LVGVDVVEEGDEGLGRVSVLFCRGLGGVEEGADPGGVHGGLGEAFRYDGGLGEFDAEAELD
jgi:hypothetical protein